MKIAMIVVGVVLCLIGYRLHVLGRGAAREPLAIELADLEKNPAVENLHLRIGEHWAIYPATVIQYPESVHGDEITDHTTVNLAYYPIVSDEHPFGAAQETEKTIALREYGGDFSQIRSFRVLVKTRRFEYAGNIPHTGCVKAGNVTGMVINRFAKLGGEERELIQQGLPKVNLDRVLILEEGRKPPSPAVITGFAGGGTILILAGFFWFLAGRSKPSFAGEAHKKATTPDAS